ncbi:TetR/AcrR family transcriptional regulator [Natranaerofaba carboxydovora]|uniref:TetR/AcrR family transcriptional regulator n=1 Tax=Natranaerofaba carboxydovora TaxID=2742683 RepID=UPI001F146ECC|nr:TetR/AcrR family transcriptional regulator [Natranaerofaba carboxydovora]UMZ74627.1 HTH-type transcriptional repressor Bm3R1 [Natranaerofaba carboxydovora]
MSNSDAVKEKEKLILDAGCKIFSERSFHEVRMQEIADFAGVGKGTIYEYFSSKEDLLNRIFKMGVKEYQKQINFKEIKGKDIWETLENHLMAHVEYLWDNKEIGRLMINSNHPFQKRIKDWMVDIRENFIRDLEQEFEEAKIKGEIKEANPVLAAKIFRGVMIEVISPQIIIEGKRPEKDEIKETITILKEGLKK